MGVGTRRAGQRFASSIRFARAPRQYRTSPNKIATTVIATTLTSNKSLFVESPGGTSEITMHASAIKNPIPAVSQTPILPPGINTACGLVRRSGRFTSLITAANMYRNGMK